MNPYEELIQNLHRLHTTELGEMRIKRNLFIASADIVQWCRDAIRSEAALIEKRGKTFT